MPSTNPSSRWLPVRVPDPQVGLTVLRISNAERDAEERPIALTSVEKTNAGITVEALGNHCAQRRPVSAGVLTWQVADPPHVADDRDGVLVVRIRGLRD